MSRSFGYFIVGLLILSGCRTSGVVITDKPLPPLSSKQLISGFESKHLTTINWLDGRASVTIQIEGSTDKFTSQIRIKSDSLFLANAKKVSVEGGRIQISRDSFYLLNRIQKSIEIRPYEHVAKAYAIPFDFNQMMNVLLARPIEPFESNRYKSSSRKGYYLLHSDYEKIHYQYQLAPQTYDIVHIEMSDQLSGQSCSISNSDFQKINETRFPLVRTFIFENGGGQKISMKVKFSKIELNVPKLFKFQVPPGYTTLD